MNRLPNPPKIPVVSASETRSLWAKRSRGAVTAAMLVGIAVPAALVVHADETVEVVRSSRATRCDDCCRSADGGEIDCSVVVLGVDPVRARTIRDHAESMRREAFATLLGDGDPEPWLVRCVVHVHSTPESFADAVGGPPVDARGATSLEFAGERVVLRRIDVMGDGPDAIPDALDHELVHVVLADHFTLASPPRWADEGLALLFDAPEKQREHEFDFQAAARRGMAWSAEELVSLEDYPESAGRQRVFYGQSAALVRWLVARRDAATFIRFLDDAATAGIEASLQRHYALDSLVSVSSAWKEVAPINSLGLADLGRERLP